MSGRESEYEWDPAIGRARANPREGLLQRFTPTADSEPALAKLHAMLAIATVFYEHREDRRHSVFGALAEVMDYLESQGVPRATMTPLAALSAALVDADRGITSPLFKADAKVGAPPKPVLQNNFDEQLAVVTECCVRHLKAQRVRPYLEHATILAAEMVNKSQLGVRVTATQMREHRERVTQLRVGSYGRQTYDLLLDSEAARLIPLEYAKAWVQSDLVTVPEVSE